jgi:hypothetical protein
MGERDCPQKFWRLLTSAVNLLLHLCLCGKQQQINNKDMAQNSVFVHQSLYFEDAIQLFLQSLPSTYTDQPMTVHRSEQDGIKKVK